MKKLLITALTLALPLAASASSYTFSDHSDNTSGTLNTLAHGTAYTWGFTNASLGTGGNLSGLEAAIHAGTQTISSATLTITGLHDWMSEPKDVLYVDILNHLASGAKADTYMPELNNDVKYGDDPFNPGSNLVTYNGSTYNALLTNTTAYKSGAFKFGSAGTGATIVNKATGLGTIDGNGIPNGDTTPGTFTAYDTTSSFTLTIQLSTANIGVLESFLSSDYATSTDLGLGFGPDCHFYDTGVSLCINTQSGGGHGVPDATATAGLMALALGALAMVGRRRRQLAA